MIQKDELEGLRAFIEKDKSESGSRGSNGWFSIKEDGEYEVRVLKMATFKSGVHWDVVTDEDGKRKPIRCPKINRGEPCPVCERVEELLESDSAEDKELAEKMSVQEKYPIVVLDVSDLASGPKLYEAPKSVFYGIFDLISKKSGAYRDMLDFKNGRNIVIDRSKKKGKKWYDYQVIPCPDRSSVDIDPAEIEALMQTFEPLSYENIAYALEKGHLPEVEENSRKSKSTTPAKKYQPVLTKTKARTEEPEAYEEEEFDDIPEPAPRTVSTTSAPRSGLSSELKRRVSSMVKGC